MPYKKKAVTLHRFSSKSKLGLIKKILTLLMATKIRLQRHGHKGYAYYHIVIADSRAPRDGRFIERIGSYNPNMNPAAIDLNFDRALYWLTVGAEPTDTVRNILSKEGVLMKKHLLRGAKQGAFTEAEAEKRFEAWKANKVKAIDAIRTAEASKKEENKKVRLEAEKAINKAKAEEIAKKRAEALKAQEEAARAAAEEAAAAANEAAEGATENAAE